MTYRFRGDALRVKKNDTGNVTYYVIEDVDRGVQHRFYELEYQVIQLLDGRRNMDKVAKQIQKKLEVETEAIDVENFVKQLLALGFVEQVEE